MYLPLPILKNPKADNYTKLIVFLWCWIESPLPGQHGELPTAGWRLVDGTSSLSWNELSGFSLYGRTRQRMAWPVEDGLVREDTDEWY